MYNSSGGNLQYSQMPWECDFLLRELVFIAIILLYLSRAL